MAAVTFTASAHRKIEEYRDADRRRYSYPPGSRKLPGVPDRADYYPGTLRVGHVEAPAHHDDIRCERVRGMMALIEDEHFDPLFDGWGDPLKRP